MKKLGLIFKETSQKRIEDTLKASESGFIINYSKLSSPDMSNLRRSLRALNASLFVVKNSVARRALKDCALENLIKAIDGPCGLIFIKDDPVVASKVLCDFGKEHEALKLQGGFLKEKPLEKKDIEAMAKLPSKEVLRAQIVMTFNSPLSRLAIALNTPLRKLVCCLEQIKNKKNA
jgi:large subunit ribosomal protein L10